MPDLEEPQNFDARWQFWQAKLDEIPEYRPLTRSTTQFWSLGEIERELHISRHLIRKAYDNNLLPGTRSVGGSGGLDVPHSVLVIHLGREAFGWYRTHGQKAVNE